MGTSSGRCALQGDMYDSGLIEKRSVLNGKLLQLSNKITRSPEFEMAIKTSVLLLLLSVGCSSAENDGGSAAHSEAKPSTAPASESAQLSLVHGTETGTDKVELTLKYSGPTKAGTAPRVAEVIVEHSENLVFASSKAGNAAVDSGKDVVVQEKDSRHTRIVVYSASSLQGLANGTIATLSYTRSGAGAATASISTERPIFAPKEAQNGLQVSEPLSF